jgi:hypothetical protein
LQQATYDAGACNFWSAILALRSHTPFHAALRGWPAATRNGARRVSSTAAGPISAGIGHGNSDFLLPAFAKGQGLKLAVLNAAIAGNRIPATTSIQAMPGYKAMADAIDLSLFKQ